MKIEKATIKTAITTKKNQSLKSQALNVYILINTALFICINKKIFINKNKKYKVLLNVA